MARRVFGRVFKRGPSWYVRVRTREGEVVRVAGPARKLAEAMLADLRLADARGEVLKVRDVPAVTLADFWGTLAPVLAARHGALTFRYEEGRYREIARRFGSKALSAVTSSDVEDFLSGLRNGHGASAATRNRYLALLGVVFAEAVARGYATSNPARGVKRQREELRPVPYLSAEDVARIAGSADADLQPPILLASETGLRRGELLALEWRDVDLAAGSLVVRRSKAKRPRTVPLTSRALSALRDLDAARVAVRAFGEDPVFSDLRGKAGADRLYKGFVRAAKKAGFPGLVFHDLRHGFASRLVRAGVDLPTVGRLLGHSASSISVTMRYAAHAPDGAERQAVARLEQGAGEARSRIALGAAGGA